MSHRHWHGGQYRADEDAFVLQAGFGWPARMVGRMRATADLGTTAGLAWLTGQLVQFRQLDAIARIRVPEAVAGQEVHRMVSVPIRGDGRTAFGVLEVGNAEAGEFTRHDLTFLQSIADGVAAAVGLHASRAGQTEQEELAVERVLALAGGLSTAAGRQGPAGISYQQDARVGAG
jgi:GAF domain-containing protein